MSGGYDVTVPAGKRPAGDITVPADTRAKKRKRLYTAKEQLRRAREAVRDGRQARARALDLLGLTLAEAIAGAKHLGNIGLLDYIELAIIEDEQAIKER